MTPYGYTGEWRDSTTGMYYLRARYYNPAFGAFVSRDPYAGTAARPMSLNGYSWVEGRTPNQTDPGGTCPTNPWWNDIPGQRCVWLANELSRQYNIPLDVLMQKDVFELEYIYALGNLNNTLSNAAILPTLFYQNPGVAWQALQQFVSGCAPVSLAGVVTAPNTGGSGAVILGAGAVIGLLLVGAAAVGTLSRPLVNPYPQVQALPTAYPIPVPLPTGRPQECTREQIEALTVGRSVLDVIYTSSLTDRIASKRVKPTQIAVQRIGVGSVSDYAYRAVCENSPFPPISLYPGRTYFAIDEGHHRFVASRLTNIPVLVASGHRPTSEFDFLRGDFVAAFEWSDVEWSN